MKNWIAFATVLALARADEKPGDCPASTNLSIVDVLSQQICVTDLDCPGVTKCCGQQCADPVCDDDVIPAQCLVNPCDFTTCPAVPDAVCLPDPCSETCESVWLTSSDDVTDVCLGDDDEDDDDDGIDDAIDDNELEVGTYENDDDSVEEDDIDLDNEDTDDDEDEKPLTKEEKKEKRKAKKLAWLKKMADKRAEKAEEIEAKRAAKLAKWQSKGKQDKVDKFQKKWEKKDAAFEKIMDGKEGKKMIKNAEKMYAKRLRKQQWKNMSPEEREAFKAEKKARKQEKMDRKQEQKKMKQDLKMRRRERKHKRKMVKVSDQ